MVYEFESKSPQFTQYNGMLVEIQLRTQLQHYWATAVETVGIFTGEALKSSQGNLDWQEFFRLASSWFALREGEALIPGTPTSQRELAQKIKEYLVKLSVIDTLLGYSHAIKKVESLPKTE